MKKFHTLVLCVSCMSAVEAFAQIQFNETWAKRYNGEAGGFDLPKALAVDKFGNTFVVGESVRINTGTDAVVVKYDRNGGQTWDAPVPSTGTGSDYGTAITVDDKGDVYVCGHSANPVTNTIDVLVAKLQGETGIPIWHRRYDYNGQTDTALDIAVNASGHVFLTGSTFSLAQFQYKILTYRLDETGELVAGWPQTYDKLGQTNDARGVALAVGPSDNVYVTGHLYNGEATGVDWVTLRYSGGGVRVWERFVTGNPAPGKSDQPSDIAVDSQNNVFVCGVVYAATSNADFGTVSYDVEGSDRWSVQAGRALQYDLFGSLDRANAIALQRDNTGRAKYVFVAGFSTDPAGTLADSTTLRYPANNAGTEDWASRSLLANNDHAQAVSAAGNGNIYVFGTSHINDGDNYLLIKYNQSGQEQSRKSYTTGNTVAAAMVSSCAGQAHVTGYDFVPSTGAHDFWSILYTQSNRTNIPVTSYNLFRGSNPTGNLASMQTSDNTYYTAQAGPVFSTAEFPVTLVVDGEIPNGLTINEMCFEVEAQTNNLNSIIQRVEFYNFATQSWVVMDERTATQNVDTTLHLAAQYDPNEFVDSESDPQVFRARVMFKQVAPTFVNPWLARIDFVGWHTVN